MTKKQKRDEWLHDIETRQRNVVFPDTVANEARFWRNLGNQPLTSSQRIGLVILFVFVFGTIASVIGISILEASRLPGDPWHNILRPLSLWLAIFIAIVLIFGPVLAFLVWATRRNLDKVFFLS